MYYDNHFLVGESIEASNPPENIDSYVCKENELKFYCPKFHVLYEEFLELYETVGFIIVR